MPTLAFGKYTARPKLSDPEIQSAAAAPFTYYPLYIPFLVAGLALLAGVVRVFRRARAYSAARFAVFVPGGIGILVAQWKGNGDMGEMVVVLGMVLQIPTAVFIAWRVFRARKPLRAIILAPIVTMVILTAGLMDELMRSGISQIVPLLIAGLIFACPIMVLRFVCRNRVSWRRIGVSLCAGFFPVVVLFIVLIVMQGASDLDDVLPAIGIIITPALISAGFVHWNAWARDIVTGNPAAFGSGPEDSPVTPGEVPAAG